jgi:hypothetical protein
VFSGEELRERATGQRDDPFERFGRGRVGHRAEPAGPLLHVTGQEPDEPLGKVFTEGTECGGRMGRRDAEGRRAQSLAPVRLDPLAGGRGPPGQRLGEPGRREGAVGAAPGRGAGVGRQRLGATEALHGRREVAGAEQAPGVRHSQPRVLVPHGRRQEFLPRRHGGLHQALAGPGQHLRHGPPVLGAGVRAHGLPHVTGPVQDRCAAPVPGACVAAQLVEQRRLEVVLQDLVIAEREPAVGGRGEHRPGLEFLKQSLATRGLQQGVAKRTAEQAEAARPGEEGTQPRSQLRQHVLGQVGADESGAAAERGDRGAALGSRLTSGGQVEQLEPGRPPARPAGQDRHRLRWQRLGVVVPEEMLYLPGAEPEVLAVELLDLTGDLETGQVEGWPPTGPERDAQLRRAKVDDPAQRPLGGRPGQVLSVVDHEQRRGAGPLVEPPQ